MTDTPKSGLPKVAAARLRAGGGGSVHPDANLLAAFSEKALPESEREQVLTHLAACADCREILSLSQPPVEEMQMAVERRGWFGLRPEFMRWAIVGASATVVVAAVLLMKPEQRSNHVPLGEEFSQSVPQSAPAQAPKAQESEESKRSSAGSANALADKGTKDGPVTGYLGDQREEVAVSRLAKKNSAPAAMMAPPPPAPGVSGRAMGGVLGGVMTADRLSGNRPAATPAPMVMADAGNEHKQATGSTAASQIPSAQVAESQVEARNDKAEAAASQGFQLAQAKEKAGEKARPDNSADSSKFNVATGKSAAKDDAASLELEAAARGRAPAKATKSSEALTYRKAFLDAERTWRIANGKLQWSLDAGKTWHGIQTNGDVKFLSVDARQSSVWAGGASGVVMRSADGGATWVPVEKGWSGDVVYLKFEDAKRGVLRTSSKEEWFTEDGGATW
ncbi:MAG TPA: zf-HC2 domain-containing protein, partial [Terriglobales bacterium]|nr:zf-HC2 domain-containing protein [Terriglobales bacterium]